MRMDRRHFLTVAIGAVPAITSLTSLKDWVDVPVKHEEQLAVLDAVRQFIKEELQLYIGKDFYTEWKEDPKRKHVILYLSRADRVMLPKEFEETRKGKLPYLTFSANLKKANYYAKVAEKQKGQHALVYQTAGTSSSRINNRLLSYELEAIAFTALHEATHRHIRYHRFGEVPYPIEEAACDLIGNYGLMGFQERYGLLNPLKMDAQLNLHERLHALMNELKDQVDQVVGGKAQDIYERGERELKLLIRQGGKFVKDRYNYPVNNALLLRNTFYAGNYFLLKDLLMKKGDLKSFMDFIISLPKDLEQAKSQIEARIASDS